MSAAGIAIITDSTCSLSAEVATVYGVQVVPLRVQLGERSYLEGAALTGSDVSSALLQHQHVSTSRPSASDFVRAYQSAIEAGHSGVASIHLSSALSGTCEAARVAAADFGAKVRVIDSRTIAMGLGFGVLTAARAARAGANADQIEAALTAAVQRSSVFFYVNSLDWLRRGGRIGPAVARLATALAVKPILHMENGDIVPLEKVRTSSKAISRLVQLACAAAGSGDTQVAVQHLDTPELARDVAKLIEQKLPRTAPVLLCGVGAVIGAHVGPGVIGIAVAPAA